MAKATLYELLRVETTATQNEIRKAYLALAKKCHPDKLRAAGEQGDVNAAFRALKKAYDILSDTERRARYDATGDLEDGSGTFQDAYERFRGVKVTKDDIERAEAEYRCSEIEKDDLQAFFEEKKGDVREVLAHIIASRNEDRDRYVTFWETELAAGRLNKKYRAQFQESKNAILTTEELDASGDDDDDEEEQSGDGDVEMDDFIASEEEDNGDNDDDDDDVNESENKMEFTPGDLVQAKWRSGKQWYDAYILSVNRKLGTYDLEYVRDKVKELAVPADHVRPKPAEKKPSPTKKARTGEDDLAAMIMARVKARDGDFLANLEAKYSKKKSKKT